MADHGNDHQGHRLVMAGSPTAPEFDLDTRELRGLGRDLRRLQGGRPSLSRYADDVKRVAEGQMIPALRQKVKSLPSKGQSREQGKESLREATAKAITFSFRVDGKHAVSMIRVNPTKMSPRKRFSGFLPSYMEGVPGFANWRHPVYGNRNVWRRQPSTPWMADVIARYTPDVMRVVEEGFAREVNHAVQGRRGRR
jgi:hypothetical protein